MPLLSGTFTGQATLWSFDGMDAVGNRIFTAPQLIEVRWVRKNKLFADSNGQQRRSSSVIHSYFPMNFQDWIYDGVSAETSPLNVKGSQQIEAVEVLPDLTGKETIYRAML